VTAEEAPAVPTPPTCQATWDRRPGLEAGSCGRVARWVITGEDYGGEVLATFLSCNTALHQAQCKQWAWEVYNVHLVKLRLIKDIYPPRGGI